MRIGVIGCNREKNLELGSRLNKLTKLPIMSDHEDIMMQLLEHNPEKYFSAYQIHVLLNRCALWNENEDGIVCDSLFTDFSLVYAALSAHIIDDDEFHMYQMKHQEFDNYLEKLDYIIYVQTCAEDALQELSPFGALPLNLFQKGYEEYLSKVARLMQTGKVIQLQDFEVDDASLLNLLKIEQVNMEQMADQEQTESHTADHRIEPLETEECKHSESPMFTESELNKRLEEEGILYSFLSSHQAIKDLIQSFQEGKDFYAGECFLSLQDQIVTCLNVVIDDGEEKLNCLEFDCMEDLVRYLKKE